MGGDTSFDIFPTGWDKTYCLRHFPNYKHYFVGDRCERTGNDWEIYETLRGVGRGFETTGPQQTSQIIFDKIIPALLSSEEDNG